MAVDHAVMEYEAKPGNEVRWLGFEANMSDLPMRGDGDLLMAPCHGYFYEDHSKAKAAISHRAQDGDTYEVSGNYFPGMGGEETHADVPAGEWADRWLGVVAGGQWGSPMAAEALVEDGGGDTHRIGNAYDPPRQTFEHVDFMAEVQYTGSMGLPAVDLSDNTVILGAVGTTNGVLPPKEALEFRGGGDGEYARIRQLEDSAGRFWFNFGLEP